ncbi:VOC family protein [Yinghuangia seranimata]|uniref:VOC family protein n=1 Tax=Yinghuangia seranimata TaxID=408067 RepID=UPI00248C4836|nr:VOC family protein [Yinghuangia seranimata]MDI2130697.1 VOC family protein [Yinghuangia seranimata]
MRLTQTMITVDCADPRGLADWWATAIGGEVVQDFGEFVMLDAEPIMMGFQRVPEPLDGKNRVHIDFASQDRVTEVERLVGLGATVVAEHSAPGLTWNILEDPAGNVFCVR